MYKMKIGDLVKWTDTEECYHLACLATGMPDLTGVRNYGIIVDNNGVNFFVRWENGDFRAQRSTDIEVISEAR